VTDVEEKATVVEENATLPNLSESSPIEASSPFANKDSAGKKLKNSLIQLPDTEWKQDRLGSECLIDPGVTVTSKDHLMHEGDAIHW
jgi:hypothetical protein